MTVLQHTGSATTMTKPLQLIQHLVKTTILTNHYYGMLLYGQGGIGKTMTTMSVVNSLVAPDRRAYKNGYTTPLSLYETLWNNRNVSILVLDDVEGLFSNKLSVSILKGALWPMNGKRMVCYTSTTPYLEQAGIPPEFEITAKVIILCNTIPHMDKPDMQALVNRMLTYEVSFSYDEKVAMCKEFLRKEKIPAEQKLLVEHLVTSTTSPATLDFSFRTLKKAMAYVQYNPKLAKELFETTTPVDEKKAAYLAIHNRGGLSVGEEVKFWVELTGHSRATFFRVKREVEKGV